MNRALKKSDSDTDFLRIAASFFVVLLHATGTDSRGCLIVNCICRFSVPVFVLITGRYLLLREKAWQSYVQKGLRFVGLAVFWAAVYSLYYLLVGEKSVKSFPVYVLTEPVHLWYLWMAAGLYLLAPMLSAFARSASKSTYLYALVVTALLGSIITILLRSERFSLVAEIMERTKLPTQTGFLFLVLLGDYLQRFRPKVPTRIWVLLFLLGTGFTVGGTLFLSRGTDYNLTLLSFFSPGAILAGVGFFGAVCALFSGKTLSPHAVSALRGAASLCLGIYLIHPLFFDLLRRFVPYPAVFPGLVWAVCKAVIVYFLSALVCFLLRKIPGVRRLL